MDVPSRLGVTSSRVGRQTRSSLVKSRVSSVPVQRPRKGLWPRIASVAFRVGASGGVDGDVVEDSTGGTTPKGEVQARVDSRQDSGKKEGRMIRTPSKPRDRDAPPTCPSAQGVITTLMHSSFFSRNIL